MAKQQQVVRGKQPQGKPPQQQPKHPSREVSTATRDGMPSAALQKKMAGGKGLSTEASDNLVPLITVLQPLSPQVLKKNESYIEGAEPGQIWLKNSEDPFYDSITFQPCFFEKYWMEWIPRTKGGGLVGRYDYDEMSETKGRPETAELFKDPERPRAIRWRMPSGNDLVETRSYSGWVIMENGNALPYSIPLASTGHTVGKDLMFRLNNRRLDNGEKPNMWSNKVTFRTKMRSNNAGEWYVLEIVNIAWITDEEQYNAGATLAAAFESGEKKAEMPVDDQVPADDNDM